MELPKDCATRETTIEGISGLAIPEPFAEGHTVTENEARVLNQVLAENVGNNLRTRIKKAIEEAGGTDKVDFKTVQSIVDDYVKEYEFGVRKSGGPKLSPLEKEMHRVSKDRVREAIKAKGFKISQVPADKINELATELMSRKKEGKEIREEAEANLERRVKAAKTSLNLDDLNTVAEDEAAA